MASNWPHNPDNPVPQKVRRALDAGDVEALAAALTIRQRRFAEEYVVDFNGTAAAIRSGYSPKTAMQQATRLLKHEGIAAYIEALSLEKSQGIKSVDPEYVIQKVTEIITKEGARDGDKLRGLELLARHLGMFVDKTEITGKDGGPLAIEQKKIIEEDSRSFIDNLKAMQRKKPDLKVVGE